MRTAYILILTICLLSGTEAYGEGLYTKTSSPMQSTSVILSSSERPYGTRSYGVYQTTAPREQYSRGMMRTGSRLISTSLDSIQTKSLFPRSTGGSVQNFVNISIRPTLHTDGTVVTPRMFSTTATNGIALLNDDGEDRGDPTGGGAGTPGNITDEEDQRPLPMGDGTPFLLLLASAWALLLFRRHKPAEETY